MKVAAVTMVFNEAAYLPVWLRHYAHQVGAAHCHVIDHGSDDGSTAGLGVSVVRLPRSGHDDVVRAGFVAAYVEALLCYYDAVLYTDVDELVVPDPAVAPRLSALDARDLPEVASAVGFNVLHCAEEATLDLAGPVGAQRRFGWFASSMCKPVLVRRRVVWAPGFHSADAAVVFGPLYLFHLRYADLAVALARLARTRAMDWARPEGGAHQRVTDADFLAMFAGMRGMGRVAASFDPGSEPLSDWIGRVLASQAGREEALYRVALDIENYELWEIPEALRAGIAPAG